MHGVTRIFMSSLVLTRLLDVLSHVSVTPNFNYSKLLYAGAHLIKASLMTIAFETTELLTFFKPANSTWTHYGRFLRLQIFAVSWFSVAITRMFTRARQPIKFRLNRSHGGQRNGGAWKATKYIYRTVSKYFKMDVHADRVSRVKKPGA